ncbi:hypothetical protein F4813DRAFT_384879 [Daldinia decipiens]|uniref:uncharacterized protein n=1 Tax=Daldinia decipiens TaxID=326647 RepID=UPI0020C28035|nr:uncharacterized protein F4813DRAFT_384879 [Daldinia decipiens]KAI1662167.1 hypothetical protein F4813DRAFT_384879 [Daldinia decipiens]
MRIWIPSRSLLFAGLRGHRPRRYSAVTSDVERVNIRVGLSGDMTIDLHNVAKSSPQSPLLVYLPPFSTAFTNTPAKLPKFIQGQPTAVINYRWHGFSPFGTRKGAAPASTGEPDKEEFFPILTWPAPLHDVLIAYSWIVENLRPDFDEKRDIYLYGSYLGASLAMSLALTESHIEEKIAVRGCIALNGIYNWTRFLPDHPFNNPPKPGSKQSSTSKTIVSRSNDPHFQELKQHAEALFVSPSGLFDPFASATLFFYNPGLLVPPNFTTSALSPGASFLANISLPNGVTGKSTLILKHPRKHPLFFPPSTSGLEIPRTLLLYTKPSTLPPSSFYEYVGRKNEDSFQTQAQELGWHMRSRTFEGMVNQEFPLNDAYHSWKDAATGRFQVHNVGSSSRDYTLNSKGEELAAIWLEDHTS